jgi:hypothetical protein
MIRSYKAYKQEVVKETLHISNPGSWMKDYDMENYYNGLANLFTTFKDRVKYVMDSCREILGIEVAKAMRDKNGGLTRMNIIFDKESVEKMLNTRVKKDAYYRLLQKLKAELDKDGIDVEEHFGSIQLNIKDSKLKSLE